MTNRLNEKIDKEINLFGDAYSSQLSLGRIYCYYLYHKVFSSYVINNLQVSNKEFIKKLLRRVGKLELLAHFKTENHEPREGTIAYDVDPEYYYQNYEEHFLIVEPDMLIGIKNDSFKILYQQNKFKKHVKPIIDLYVSLDKESKTQ